MRWIKQARRETKEHAVAIAIILAITVIFFSPLLRGRTYSMVAAHMVVQYPWRGVVEDLFTPEIVGLAYPQTDHAEGLYPTSVFATNALRSGQLPMWSPYSFSGVPIMETGLGNGLQYPPKLLSMLFLSPIRQHDFLLFTHLLMAGLAMYALLRCWGVNVLGALLGAIIWELNGHNTFFLVFEFVAVAAAWFPLMLLGATMTIRKQSWRWAIATGVAVGMSVLHGIQHFEYLGCIALGCWYGTITILAARKLWIDGKRQAALVCLSLPLISLAIAAALSAASWLSLVSVLSHVHRAPNEMEAQLLTAKLPLNRFVRNLLFPRSALGLEALQADFAPFAFVGVPAFILIPAAFMRRRIVVILASITGLIGAGITLGLRPLIIFLTAVIPYFGSLRLWDGFYLWCFAIAVLAAFGLSEITERLEVLTVRKFIVPVLLIPLFGVQCLQLVLLAWTINPSHPVADRWLFPETPVVSYLKAGQGEFHVLPLYQRDPSGAWTPPILAGRAALVFGLRSSSGYESLAPDATAKLWTAVQNGGTLGKNAPPAFRPDFHHDSIPVRLLENLSVGLLATPPSTEPRDANGSNPVADGSLQLVYNGRDGSVYKVQNALPRAFLAPQVVTAQAPDDALRMLVDPGFDAGKAAIVIGEKETAATGLPSLGSSGSEIISGTRIVSDRVNDVEVEVNSPRAAMLVLNDSWDAGWKVQVDGVDKPLVRVNYAFRGVAVPEGEHRVVFLYRPPLILLGLTISTVSGFLLMVLGGWMALSRLVAWRKRTNDRISAKPAADDSLSNLEVQVPD